MKRFSLVRSVFFLFVPGSLAAVVAGCSQGLEPADDDVSIDTSDDTEVDDTSNPDTGQDTGDTGQDTGDTGNTTGPSGVDCAADYSGSVTQPMPDECVTETIQPGQGWVLATTAGGNNWYDWNEYDKVIRCHGGYRYLNPDYSGAERIFEVAGLPPNSNFRIQLDTPCDGLRLTVLDATGNDLTQCPVSGGSCATPYQSDVSDGDSVHSANARTGASSWTFLLIVDSTNGNDGANFGIRIDPR